MRRRSFLAGLVSIAARGGPDWFEQVASSIQAVVGNGKVRAAAICVRQGKQQWQRHFGEVASIDTPFLIASITKPMTATGVMRLVDTKQIRLEDAVSKYIPECKHPILVRHLLTHTCGLPDQLPMNVDLRRRHAPLSDFVKETLKTPLLFTPGSKCSYSSMGILLAKEIAERVTKTPFPDHLAKNVFAPFEMKRTFLGLGPLAIKDTAQCQVEQAEAEYGSDPTAANWNWNTSYWRNLAVPWGGAHSTAPDIARLLWAFLHPDGRVLSESTSRLMLTNHNVGLNQPWGLGWSLKPPGFGHSGSTGTLCWADPKKDAAFVLLTTLPARVSNKLILNPVSEKVAKAL